MLFVNGHFQCTKCINISNVLCLLPFKWNPGVIHSFYQINLHKMRSDQNLDYSMLVTWITIDMRRTQYEVPIPSFCYIFVFIDNIMNINCGATLYKILVLQCLWPPPIWCMETSVTLETSQFSEIMKTLRVFIPNVVEKHLPCKLRIIIVYKRLHLIFKF